MQKYRADTYTAHCVQNSEQSISQFFVLVNTFFEFFQTFFVFFIQNVDFSELLMYYIDRGGDSMEYKRIATCSDRIKVALKIRSMKQSDLVRLTEIPKSAISQYISGAFEPKQDRIYLMAKALNVSEAWLMGLDVPMERKTVGIINQRIIAKNIKTFREDAKMSQTEFAQLLGVDEDTILNIENGNHIPNKEMLFLICDIFKITPDFLNGTIEELYDSGDTDAEYRVLRYQQPLITTDLDLSEVEKILIELFRKLPDEAQKMYLEVLRTSLKSQS